MNSFFAWKWLGDQDQEELLKQVVFHEFVLRLEMNRRPDEIAVLVEQIGRRLGGRASRWRCVTQRYHGCRHS
jgi:hypothetical protein